MLVRIVRVLMGFAVACAAAAFTLVAFVYAPGDASGVGAELSGPRLSEAGLFVLLSIPHIILSAAVPALVAATFAERHKIANWPFYALVGLATAAGGFLVQYMTEALVPGQPSIFQTYALIAFLIAGLIGGLVYWAVSGRHAGTATTTATT